MINDGADELFLSLKNRYKNRLKESTKGSDPANICWSLRRLEDTFKACLEDIFNTSSA